MSDPIGPDETIQGSTVSGDEASERSGRSRLWQWLAILLLLLLVLWIYWQYLSQVSVSPQSPSTTTTIVTPPIDTGDKSPEIPIAEEEGPTVPDVVGMTRSAAISAIRAAGYVASVTDVYGTSHPASTVFEQNPSAGARLGEGESVGMLVQLRPDAGPRVTVPQMTGLPRSTAERRLKSLGLQVVISYFPDANSPGLVKSQWPLGGDTVAKGGEVQIQITVER